MNRNALKLPIKDPDDKQCNARTPTGYCKNKPGFRTIHFGDGRCWLHGGNTPATIRKDAVAQALYTKYLPTTLAIEFAEIKSDPLFTTLFSEFAVLKLIAEGLIKHLPEDISSVYGRFVCSECKKDLSPLQEDQLFIFAPVDAKFQQKRLDKFVSTIEALSRLFEKISKHEERQKRFIAISELEAIMSKWGKILMKYFGDHENIQLVQQEIMQSGFVRHPGDQDKERLDKFRGFQREIYNTAERNGKAEGDRDVLRAISDVHPELIETIDIPVIENDRTIKKNAKEILEQIKKEKSNEVKQVVDYSA